MRENTEKPKKIKRRYSSVAPQYKNWTSISYDAGNRYFDNCKPIKRVVHCNEVVSKQLSIYSIQYAFKIVVVAAVVKQSS